MHQNITTTTYTVIPTLIIIRISPKLVVIHEVAGSPGIDFSDSHPQLLLVTEFYFIRSGFLHLDFFSIKVHVQIGIVYERVFTWNYNWIGELH